MAEASPRNHWRRPLRGRDPSETHRVATPLELLFDLTLVVAFGTAADGLARFLAERHYVEAIAGYAIAVLSAAWAWMSYSWFASAFDNDDWLFRVATLMQMVGVIVLSLGIPEMFESLGGNSRPDLSLMVPGYVIMRVSMLLLWARVARNDREHKRAANAYMLTIGAAQVGWVAITFLPVPLPWFLAAASLLFAVELLGPYLAERRAPTPWHAQHITERHGLLVLITLGEGIIGTVIALNALVHSDHGWTFDAALLAIAGIGLIFGMWWMYFTVPWGDVLTRHRDRAFVWSGGHILLVGSSAAVGGGLHVAAYLLEGKALVGETAALLTVAGPVGGFIVALNVLYTMFVRQRHHLQPRLLAGTAGVVALSIAASEAGASLSWSLVILMFAPVVTIVAYEAVGHRAMDDPLFWT